MKTEKRDTKLYRVETHYCEKHEDGWQDNPDDIKTVIAHDVEEAITKYKEGSPLKKNGKDFEYISAVTFLQYVNIP